ncbi:MAG: acetyl-CoA carboxylase, carboxyltransferase subunit beta [Oscillospiraceae bacterium]|jgi:acetyl-CoA carboxylase carboxyl transferase subunit beta|nr:acetyl-CoA carboxylase, carboxyltransferase subunit beta [Oscillospiraceae bacterium]
MGLEDLLKKVKHRFNDEKEENKTEPAPKPEVKSVKIPEDLFFKCPRCRTASYMEDFEKDRKVCAHCHYHARLTWKERLEQTADGGSFVEHDAGMESLNPISYPDYADKLKKLREQCDMREAVVTGECTVRGYKAVIGIMDSNFMMASMGSVVGEKITRAFEYATDKNLPVIMFTASGGARMQEGIISLMQMAKTSGAIARFSEAGGLYITVMTDPTTGGVTASFASLGDIIIAEPKVLIGFAGRRVIQDTIKQKLPDEFQSAEFLLENGFVDMIIERKKMRSCLARLMKVHNYEKGAGK